MVGHVPHPPPYFALFFYKCTKKAVYHRFIGFDVLFSPAQERIWYVQRRVRSMILRRRRKGHRCVRKFTFELKMSHSLCLAGVLDHLLHLALLLVLYLVFILLRRLLGRRCGAESHP